MISRRLAAILAGFVLQWASSSPVLHAQVNTDLSGYFLVLDRLAELADSAEDRPSLARLVDFMKDLPDTMVVDLSVNGRRQTRTVSNHWIKRGMDEREEEETLSDSLRRAEFLAENVANFTEELVESADDRIMDSSARSKVKDILAQDKYKRPEKKKEEEERRRRMRARSEPVMERENQSRGSNWMVWVFFALLAGIFIVLMVLAGRNLDTEVVEEVVLEADRGLIRQGEPTKSEGMRQLALTRAGEGRLKEAARYYYLHFILLLHEQKVIAYRPSYTAGEYESMVLTLMPHMIQFSHATRFFDAVVYGQFEISDPEFQALRLDVDAVSAEMQRRRK